MEHDAECNGIPLPPREEGDDDEAYAKKVESYPPRRLGYKRRTHNFVTILWPLLDQKEIETLAKFETVHNRECVRVLDAEKFRSHFCDVEKYWYQDASVRWMFVHYGFEVVSDLVFYHVDFQSNSEENVWKIGVIRR
jgi:hypothetical protein